MWFGSYARPGEDGTEKMVRARYVKLALNLCANNYPIVF